MTVGGALSFNTVVIPGCEPHRLGRSVGGAPTLLLVAASVESRSRRAPPIELEHLAVQHDVECRIWGEDGQVEHAPFTVVQCTSADFRLRRQFLSICSSLLASLGSTPRAGEVYAAVTSLVELFRALSQPQMKSVQGLWAELFLIARASKPVELAQAWHATPEDRYDFNAGTERIEVKSAAGRVRRHRFSLEQLRPPAGASLIIASIYTERSGAGVSLAKLLSQVRAQLSATPNILMRVEELIIRTLGQGYSRALDIAFDWELACESLRFFSYKEIPRIACALPAEISEVSFVSDISGLQPLNLKPLRTGIFAAAQDAT